MIGYEEYIDISRKGISMGNKREQQGSYIMNSSDGGEMARLIDQDLMMTRGTGILPADLDVSEVYEVLDVACGPGGWIRAAARHLPDVAFVGVDINKAMIDYASAFARVSELPNASFQVMDVTQPLAFPSASFDLIHARLLVAVLYKRLWPIVVAEYGRVVRPGGWVVLTEADKAFTTNSEAIETYFELVLQAMLRADFYVGRSGAGIIQHLPTFLEAAGLVDVHSEAYCLDASYGTPAYGALVSNLNMALPLSQTFLLKMGLSTKEDLDALFEQAMLDMQSEDFRGQVDLTRVWGRKPGK